MPEFVWWILGYCTVGLLSVGATTALDDKALDDTTGFLGDVFFLWPILGVLIIGMMIGSKIRDWRDNG